ncbi:nicotinate-nucleotide--dimethylbenzimidazole phosphoribosyltransferase [Kitasatospora sp. NPDC049258]|uniref:nicotinate-nucleotide--dimethylbenzimidazole phosphoribosyltransferase n=1 Tax=Kitasatospora sp. NPDC049258 TaxID=3155394 RepID=UPI0034481F4C
MTDGGRVPSAGVPEQPHGGADPLGPPEGTGMPGAQPPGQVWATEPRPAYTFLDQLDEEEDELLMPGPQGSWGEPLLGAVETVNVIEHPAPPVAVPAALGETMPLRTVAEPLPQTPPAGVPVEPSWPPLNPPLPVAEVFAPELQQPVPAQFLPGQPVPEQLVPEQLVPEQLAPAGAEPVVPPAPVPAPQPVAPAPVEAQAPPAPAQPVRRPLHAGPPIPDPSLMTGHVPVRSLADRGPSGSLDPQAYQVRPLGGTPAHGTPVPPPIAAEPVLPVAPVAEPVVVEVPAVEPVAVAPVVEAPPVVEVPIVEVPAAVEVPVAEPTPEPVSSPEPEPAAEPAPAPAAIVLDAPAAPPVEVAAQPEPVEQAAEQPAEQPVVAVAPVAPVFVEPVFAEAGPTAAAPAPEAGAAATVLAPAPAEVAVEEPPQTVTIPAQAPAPAAQHRRISAFLAAPAPHGLPVVEPLTSPGSLSAPVAAGTGDLLTEPLAPAVESTPEPVAEPVAITEPQPQPQPQSEARPEPQPAEAAAEPEPEAPQALQPEPAEPQPEAQPEAQPEPAAEEPAPTTAVDPTEPAQPAEEPAEAAQAAEPEQPAEAAQAAEPDLPAEQPPTEQPPAAERPPAAPGYDEAGRDAVHQVIRERRDIRNGFRPDPIPHEVLIRVLEAAHTAPSVGYSQPWDFVVIRSAKTRQKMHALAERQREVYADSLPRARAKQFKEIKIEAILETPVNIVVTADRTRGGRHTLGRHTQPQMAPYSAALAVENLWLAARAEGLGVGWVSFFDEEEMIRELGLPEHLDVVAYLCVGYVDAFPDEPELQQQGWAKKRPLAWVVHEEQYGNRALPGEEPHSLLSDTLRGIRPLDAKSLGEAWDRQKRMTKPAGSLGMLEIIAAQLCGLSRKCPPPIPEPACVAIFAGDHGVHAQGVTPWPQEVTGQMVANFLAGGAVVNAFAAQVGAEVCVVDVGVKAELPEPVQQGRSTGLLPRKVKPGTDDMTQGPAMTREEALKALEVGIETARDLVAAGNKVLITGDMGIANTTASAALISVFTGTDPAEVTGRGTGIDDDTHTRKVEVVRRALALHRPDPADPIGVLAAVGGLEHAAIAGFLLGAASLRTPVILDGVIAGSAALAAKAIAPEVLAACIAGHRSAEPGHQAALAKLGLRPLIDLDLRLGEGTGALLALPLVQSAARAMHDVATFDSAGVTEKG